MKEAIVSPTGRQLGKFRIEARMIRKVALGAVPAWIRELSLELGEPDINLEGVRKIFGGLKPSLSEEIIAEREGERD
jgi:hypothetical protein